MLAFYKSFDEVRERTFDGLVITRRAGGAPALRGGGLLAGAV